MPKTPEVIDNPTASRQLFDVLAQIHGGGILYEEEKNLLVQHLRNSIGGQDNVLIAVPIISAIGRFGSFDDIPLLQQGLARERSYGIKIAAGKAIRIIEEKVTQS